MNTMNSIFIQLMGGLGNQLFQYAAGFLQKKVSNGNLYFIKANNSHDSNDYRTIFNLEQSDVPEHFKVLYQEDGFALWYPVEYISVLFYGYFQNYTVLKCILPEFKEVLLESLQVQRESMAKKYNVQSNSGFIHVRRGDYLLKSEIHHVQDISYYISAIELLPNVKKWYIFSDDITWVKTQKVFQNLDAIYITENDPILCIALMTLIHDGAIIANSTFSWWGAYLAGSNTIYPKRWINNSTPDLFPEIWRGI